MDGRSVRTLVRGSQQGGVHREGLSRAKAGEHHQESWGQEVPQSLETESLGILGDPIEE